MPELPDMKDIPRPSLEITMSNGRKIKMTYGLEMDIRRMLPVPSAAVQLVMHDPHTQDYIVRRCLTDKKGMIHDEKELVEDVDLDSDDVERLLLWVTEHCLYFFVKRATAMGELSARYEELLPKPSLTGSENSALTTPSAGPSESAKES